jgi:hypothetical protein
MTGRAPDVVLAERTGASCAVASWQGRLHLAWTGSDMRLNTISSPDGWHFEGKRTLSHRSYKTVTRSSGSSSGRSLSDTTTEYVPLAPALAATASGLVLAWTATNRRLNVSGPGMGDAGYLELGETSSNPPALGAEGHNLTLAWTGTDSHINLLHVHAGAWSSPWRLDETSSCAPAVCMAGQDPTEMVLAWTGTDRHLNLLQTRDGVWGQPWRLDEKSAAAPAICAISDTLVLAWTGSDRHVNLLSLQRGVPAAPVRLDATSSCSPTLCPHLDALVLAWTGTDGRPNLLHLHDQAGTRGH